MFRNEYKFLCFISCCVIGVISLSLEGSVLTRYDPCSLGALHFDRITDGFWQAVVNLGLYSNLGDNVTINIQFEKSISIYAVSENTTVEATNNKHNYMLQPKNGVPYRYIFFVKIEENGTDIPIVEKFALNNYTLCDDAIKASETVSSLDVKKNNSEQYMHMCGRRALQHAEMTSMRTEAKAGDWPWHVAIFVKNKNDEWEYQCGGNVISRTAIVTAGHCVCNKDVIVEASRIRIVAGVGNHSDLSEVGRQEFIVDQVILHPSYDDVHATADLAVLKIRNLTYTEFVQPICIWGPVYDKTNLVGYQATMVGFGTTEKDKDSEVLRSAYIMVQNDTTCIDYSEKIYKPLLNEFSFCAGYGPNSTINPRNGDSGGGLIVPTMQPDHKLSWFLRGVLSKCGVGPGQTKCNAKYYVVYTDVGPHYGWIYHHSGLQFNTNIVHEVRSQS